jgi:hypothetical protein
VGDVASGVQAADFWNRGEKLNAGLSALGALPFIPTLHTVYHGSPHKFNKFDMSKIGTGEGAQAYGHGLYFAESPGVAKSYQEALSQKAGGVQNRGYLNGIEYTKLAPEEKKAMDFLKLNDENIDFALDLAKRTGNNGAAKVLSDVKTGSSKLEFNTGNMYKVDIPDEAIPRMLDWESPLNKRPELLDIVQKERPGYMTAGLPNDIITEADAYLSLADKVGPAKAAEIFKQAGIPGIKYKDAMSRGTDAGTSNFVLFDDQLPRILEINGNPTGLLSWADEAKKAKKK